MRGSGGGAGHRPSPGEAAAALRGGEVRAYLQPVVRLSDRRTVGFEALARWAGADGTVLEAEAFVPELVATGLGLELLARVAADALAGLAARRGAGTGSLFLSVNASASDLGAPLVALIGRLAARHGVPPEALVVEVTEDAMSGAAAAEAALRALKRAGVRLALDDFGRGHSTLERLRRFPFDYAKADRSLAPGRGGDAALRGLIAAASRDGVPVVAEGIEDEATARASAALGCEFGQGFLFGRAQPA